MKRLTFLVSFLFLSLSIAYFVIDAQASGRLDYGTVQAEKGAILRYRRADTGFLLVLTPGQEILGSLAAFQKAMKFSFATATGIGNVTKVQLGQYNMQARAMDKSPIYQGPHEVSSLMCNMSMLVDVRGAQSPLPHCHINIALSPAEGFRVVGGHLISATIAVVGEIFITTAEISPPALKTHDPYFNGDAFDLNGLDDLNLK